MFKNLKELKKEEENESTFAHGRKTHLTKG
jgi:hypothetical protein